MMIQRKPSREGYTLTELVLVLGLLVAVAAVSLPRFQTTLPSFRLRKSGDVIRQAWNHARIQAMKTGRTYIFKFAINDRTYRIEPWFGSNDYLEGDLQSSATAGQGVAGSALGNNRSPLAGNQQQNGAGGAGGGQGVSATNKLPDGVVFGQMNSQDTIRDAQTQAQGQIANSMTADSTGVTWSRPVMFYADGTTSTSQITLINKNNFQITVSIRSLTGAVEVSDITNGPAFGSPAAGVQQ